MKKLVLFLLLPLNLFAQNTPKEDEQKIQATIRQFFEGMSELDVAKTRSYTTDDFLLLENGSVWNNDTMAVRINRMKTKVGSYQRINTIDFIRTEIKENIAWTTFHNHADIKMDDKERNVNWLESAVLIKVNNEWKIQLFHSTII